MVTRTGGSKNSVGAGYLTFGAGSRAEGDDALTGQAYDADEQFGSLPAADVFAQRTGRPATGGLLNLSVEALATQNEQGRFSPRLGALGDALKGAGIDRAVIANSDGPQPVVDGSLPTSGRAAVSALMDHDGAVPGGQVNNTLLMRDPKAPFGLRLDQDAVVDAFNAAWRPHTVVLVEASDLQRAAYARAVATSPQIARQLKSALVRTDALVGVCSRVSVLTTPCSSSGPPGTTTAARSRSVAFADHPARSVAIRHESACRHRVSRRRRADRARSVRDQKLPLPGWKAR